MIERGNPKRGSMRNGMQNAGYIHLANFDETRGPPSTVPSGIWRVGRGGGGGRKDRQMEGGEREQGLSRRNNLRQSVQMAARKCARLQIERLIPLVDPMGREDPSADRCWYWYWSKLVC